MSITKRTEVLRSGFFFLISYFLYDDENFSEEVAIEAQQKGGKGIYIKFLGKGLKSTDKQTIHHVNYIWESRNRSAKEKIEDSQ